MKNNCTMKNFVDAYTWLFGSTKKYAKEIYKNEDKEYIEAVIFAYRTHCKIAFFED